MPEPDDPLAGITLVRSSSPDLIGWEPLTNPIKPTNVPEVLSMVAEYKTLRAIRAVAIVRAEKDGALCIWEHTSRAELWKP